jgi:3-carboxy-cis,cis-muconate cycloisomerase
MNGLAPHLHRFTVTLAACLVANPTLAQAQARARASTADTESSTSVFDSQIYRDLFTTPEMRLVFSDARLIAYWLRFESELAAAQAEVGVIPREAAQAIAKAAVLSNIDMDKLREGTIRVGRAIDPLLNQVRAAGGPWVADYLHEGSTTQDPMDTATVLQIRDGLDIVQRDLKKLILRLADLADAHKATPMIARTNGQDAVPTTLGMMLASYMTELHRHADRLQSARRRVLVGQFGSAVGTLSSAGPQALRVRAVLMKRLGLAEPDLSWNASRDNFAEVVQTLALMHGTFGRIATDINLWSRTADNGINEGEGGASSTMPQKRNPRASEFLAGAAELARLRAAGAMSMMAQSETRQGGPWISEWSTIPEMFMLTAASLDRAQRLFNAIIIRPEVLRERFDDSRQYAMAEAVQTWITPRAGRGAANELIKDAIKRAPGGTPFKQVILGDARLSELVGLENVDRVLDPANYLGQAPRLVADAVARTRAAFK